MTFDWNETAQFEEDIDTRKGYRIYRNLHRRSYSIQAYVRGRGWRVVAHSTDFVGGGLRFVVSEAGRQRVLRDRRKNVHAFVYAERIWPTPPGTRWLYRVPVTYSPYAEPPLGADGKGAFFWDGPHLKIGTSAEGRFSPDGYVLLKYSEAAS